MVVGVIGHVDHGKTALVRALSGMETDRLAEEKRRGISIALGFAHFCVAGATIDLIDMPGHERFVRTMVSGATGIDAALMVVAANEGIKPQTVEHLDIAGLLGVPRVIVTVSKADLATADEAEAVASQAAAMVRKAGMAVAATVLTSVVTGQGLVALGAALAAAIPGEAAGADAGFAYLPIDRVFSVPGRGTVVTGTLRRGPLAVSDPLALLPGGPARLRGLQVHGAPVTVAQPGQRVAANLRDVEPGQVARGAALATPGLLAPSTWLTVKLAAVAGSAALPTLSRLILLFGTEEVEVRLRLLDCDALAPGAAALAQLRSVRPICLPARECFILRRASPPQTVAGGRVIDPVATRLRRHTPCVLARLARLSAAAPAAIVQAELAAAGAGGVALARLAQLAGVSDGRAAALLQAPGIVLGPGRVAVLRPQFERTVDAVAEALAAADAEVPASRLAALLPWAGPAVLEGAVAELARRGTVQRARGGVRLHRPERDRESDREHAVRQAAAAAMLAEALRRGGLSPPDPRTLATTPQASRLLDRLVREGVAVRAPDKVQKREVLFHREAVEAAKRELRLLLGNGRAMLVGEAGAALGISRKFCVPLLEHLDAVRFTRRVADRRVLAQLNCPTGSSVPRAAT